MTPLQIRDYCKRYEFCIFVRVQNPEGRWVSSALGELRKNEREAWISRWIEEGRVPIRVKGLEDGETNPAE